MGRKKIEIEKIDDNNKRNVTFTKRRQGLFKKASDICVQSDAQIAVVAFSAAGNVFSFGHPSVDSVIDHYISGGAQVQKEEDTEERIEHVDKRRKISDNGGGFWWDQIDIEKLDSYDKMSYMQNKIMGLKQNIRKRIQELTLSSSLPSSSSIAPIPAAPGSTAIAAAPSTSVRATLDAAPSTAVRATPAAAPTAFASTFVAAPTAVAATPAAAPTAVAATPAAAPKAVAATPAAAPTAVGAPTAAPSSTDIGATTSKKEDDVPLLTEEEFSKFMAELDDLPSLPKRYDSTFFTEDEIAKCFAEADYLPFLDVKCDLPFMKEEDDLVVEEKDEFVSSPFFD